MIKNTASGGKYGANVTTTEGGVGTDVAAQFLGNTISGNLYGSIFLEEISPNKLNSTTNFNNISGNTGARLELITRPIMERV